MVMVHFKNISRPCMCAVYTIIIYMFATNFYCTPTEGVKIQYNKYFDGEELVTIYKISLQRCICECNAKKDRCLSVIYKRTFTSCRLNVKNATTLKALSDKPGSIYVEMDDDISGCENYNFASKTDNSAVPFNQPACGKPRAKANATTLGNVYSNGSRIQYVCDEGFKQLDQTESVTVCLHNESWSQINFTCKPDTIGKSCNARLECLEQLSECREQRCVCIQNHSYSLTEYTCVHSHQGCNNSLISDPKVIPNDHFTASSNYSSQMPHEPTCYPWFARLDSYQIENDSYCGTWASNLLDTSQYIQVNLSNMHSVRAITTEGRFHPLQFVTLYKVLFSNDGSSFKTVLDHNATDLIFPGNSNKSNMSVTNKLPCPIQVQYIRINPQGQEKHISLRFDVKGCTLQSADCDFENGTCGWQHVNESLKKWELGRPNITQVPPNDHTCSSGKNSTGAVTCSYMYITSDQQEYVNAQVILTIRESNASRCLSLWHMASTNFSGSLNVITAKCEHGIEKLINITNTNFSENWNMSTVRVESGVYQIVIEGAWSNTSRGILAMDDIKLNENDCQYI